MDIKLNKYEENILFTVCRCCLKKECFRNISSEYYHSGQKEVYNEMLKATFEIQISNPNILGYVPSICEGCIFILREAATFKHMVLQSEHKFDEFLENLKNQDYESKMTDNDNNMKVAEIKCESSPVMKLHNDSIDDNEFIDDIKMDVTQREVELDENNQYSHKKKSKIKPEPDLKPRKDWSRVTERRGNGPILRGNSLKLIANSTIFVFQWNKSRYRCFCCKEPFSDVNTLREHSNTNHSLKSIEKKIIYQQNRLVKVEVSILNCNLCGVTIDNLSDLREHLILEHDFVFELKEDLLVPFKIGGNLSCQLCDEKFNVFRLLNIHMNKHYQKQVCHICGAAFSNLVFLNLHKSRSHKPLKCRLCEVNFTNKIEKKAHEINVHKIKYERKLRFPCPYCKERFFQENLRVQHLVDQHGLKKPEFKCSICDKIFITKSLCNNHLKSVHLKEKSHECSICHNLFYTKSDVARHRVTHTGEKKFSCAVCNNPFASKDSLRRHMKRTHGLQ